MGMRKICLAVMGLMLALIGVACKGEPLHVHNYNTDWEKDANSHWHCCLDCSQTRETATHTGGEATCEEKALCETCGKAYGELGEHTYTIQNSDENYHWKECACGLQDEASKTAHSGGEATCQALAKCEECETEYGEYAKCDYSIEKQDEVHHWLACACGEVLEGSKNLHYGGNATCKDVAICEECGIAYGDLEEHSYSNKDFDEVHHWQYCVCGEVDESTLQMHYGGTATCKESAVCAGCGISYGEVGSHSYVLQGHDETSHWKYCACGEIDEETRDGHYGGRATCQSLALCEGCNTPYGEFGGHEFNVDKQEGDTVWEECLCGEVDEDSIQQLPPNPDDSEEEEEEPVFLAGTGTYDDPYVLVEGVTCRVRAWGYFSEIYFVFETTTACIASFGNLINVDGTSFQYGTNINYMESVDPTYIELSAWETHYFLCQGNSAGEIEFTFTIE